MTGRLFASPWVLGFLLFFLWPFAASLYWSFCRFVLSWNDFGSPLLYLNNPHKFPLAYGLERFVSSYSDQTHLLLAAAVMFTLPMVVLFFLAQRTFVQGISTSGIKG